MFTCIYTYTHMQVDPYFAVCVCECVHAYLGAHRNFTIDI